MSPPADTPGGATATPTHATTDPEGGLLDLHEESSDPRQGCERWPEPFRLLNEATGELVKGRCGATNLCAYCARLAAVENSECLALDAVENTAPGLWIVLTTRTATIDTRRFYRSREQLWRAVSRRWPEAEYAALVEFTTGYGPTSGGKRRPHWNILVKGIPVGDLQELRELVTAIWCRREDAEPAGQFLGEIGEAGGLMRYLALHFQKESQAPPPGWRGHRFLKSRGYFDAPMPEVRERAKRALRFKREVWKLDQHAPELPSELVDELANRALELEDATTWRLKVIGPVAPDPRRREREAARRPFAGKLGTRRE